MSAQVFNIFKDEDSIMCPGDLFQCLTMLIIKKKKTKQLHRFVLFIASSVTLNSLKHKGEAKGAAWQIWKSIAIKNTVAVRSGRNKWLFHNINNICLNFSGNTECWLEDSIDLRLKSPETTDSRKSRNRNNQRRPHSRND